MRTKWTINLLQCDAMLSRTWFEKNAWHSTTTIAHPQEPCEAGSLSCEDFDTDNYFRKTTSRDGHDILLSHGGLRQLVVLANAHRCARQTGEGAAYGTVRREHVLNVPAGKMSCIPEDPDHLLRWLGNNGKTMGLEDPSSRTANTFIPRQVYSEYIKSTLQQMQAMSSANLEQLKDEALEANITDLEHFEIKLASGNILHVDGVVLCLGNEPSIWPFAHDEAPEARLFGSPWKQDYAKVDADSSVLIVGTGLTMADAIVSLHSNGHKGKITAISRRGIIPKSLDASLKPVQYHFEEKQQTAMELYADIMERISRHTSLGGDWREAVDGLRPWTAQLWKGLSTDEKRLFISKGKSVWDFHRHRVAPEIHAVLTENFINGRAEVLRGHVLALKTASTGVVLATLELVGQASEQRAFDYVINCTGPTLAADKSRNPLMQTLLRSGLVIPGSSGLGIQVTDEGQAIGQSGPSKRIFVCGPHLIDRDFEAIAVPELKQHARTAAQNVLKAVYRQ